tara:strand:+ start:111 stop:1577 length:1467 start_codon:yes stop_codon:yes gene_type:complete
MSILQTLLSGIGTFNSSGNPQNLAIGQPRTQGGEYQGYTGNLLPTTPMGVAGQRRDPYSEEVMRKQQEQQMQMQELQEGFMGTDQFKAFDDFRKTLVPTQEQQMQMQELQNSFAPTQEQRTHMQDLEAAFRGTPEYQSYIDAGRQNYSIHQQNQTPWQQGLPSLLPQIFPQPTPVSNINSFPELPETPPLPNSDALPGQKNTQQMPTADATGQFNFGNAFDELNKNIDSLPNEIGTQMSNLFESKQALVPKFKEGGRVKYADGGGGGPINKPNPYSDAGWEPVHSQDHLQGGWSKEADEVLNLFQPKWGQGGKTGWSDGEHATDWYSGPMGGLNYAWGNLANPGVIKQDLLKKFGVEHRKDVNDAYAWNEAKNEITQNYINEARNMERNDYGLKISDDERTQLIDTLKAVRHPTVYSADPNRPFGGPTFPGFSAGESYAMGVDNASQQRRVLSDMLYNTNLGGRLKKAYRNYSGYAKGGLVSLFGEKK